MSYATTMTRRCSRIFALTLVLFLTALTTFAQSPPLTIEPGTVLTIRVNEALSSDHNQPGDVFSGTLMQPLVVHGVVVAQRGQTVAGRVVESKKAGMVSGTSRLRLTLTNVTLADGQNVQVRSQMLVRNGPTSEGRDVAAVAGTTALGAALGGAFGWGRGAAIGAAAGAGAGVAGVLLTRGYATVVYPETVLTFQVTAPASIDTDYAQQAFHAVNPMLDYGQPQPAPPAQAPTSPYPPAQASPYPPQAAPQVVVPPVVVAAPYPYPYAYGPQPYPYYYPYGPYGPYAYPYFYGPAAFSVVVGNPYRFYRPFYGPHFGHVPPHHGHGFVRHH
jgi:hypothetical protein